MKTVRLSCQLLFLLGIAVGTGVPGRAQNFGSSMQRKKIVLVRKLPPTGHIDGSSFKVVVTGTGLPADFPPNLKSTLESLIIRNDSSLHTEDVHADAIIECRITTFSQPPPQVTTEEGLTLGKKGGPVQNQPMTHVTALMTTAFEAKNERAGHSIAADTVTSKFDQEYAQANSQQGKIASMTSTFSRFSKLADPHADKSSDSNDKPPTAAQLRDKLIEDTAMQIASRLVNTSEQVEVFLARGGGLDDADTLIEQKLWTRALEQLETMPAFSKPEDDAYRLYNLGVVNEALAYQAEDINKAKKYLQEASIDYGKAIDARPAEKLFLQPQTRIDTALAHYNVMGDRKAAEVAKEQAVSAVDQGKPAQEALTNGDVISMVAAKLDEGNILDTIQHAGAVSFDLSAKGQVDLAKSGVSGKIITAMKTRARAQ